MLVPRFPPWVGTGVDKEMNTLVLLRHGQSTWNAENRFTGWTDVDLTARGVQEAEDSARLLIEGGYTFDAAYTSVLKRAVRTLSRNMST